jgi:hypothetical protein
VRLDHIAVTAGTLDAGAAWVQAVLGTPLVAGGRHAAMGTHNRLLALGDCYLEVIAVDPDASPPGRPRWFGLDRRTGPPRLSHWIVACDDLAADLAAAPPGAGRPMDLGRDDLRWRMAVPADGRLPFDDAFPALIEWQGAAHPLGRLPDSGLRLLRIEIRHPRAEALLAALAGRLADPRIAILAGPVPRLTAEVMTPSGLRRL